MFNDLTALILQDNRDDWLGCNSLARGCHRVLTGLRQMIPRPTPTERRLVVNERHDHCLRPSSAHPTDGFLCQRSCLSILSHGTWTQFKYYLITSLCARRLIAGTWKRLAWLMDSFSRECTRRETLCMHNMREGCERPRDVTSIRTVWKKNLERATLFACILNYACTTSYVELHYNIKTLRII